MSDNNTHTHTQRNPKTTLTTLSCSPARTADNKARGLLAVPRGRANESTWRELPGPSRVQVPCSLSLDTRLSLTLLLVSSEVRTRLVCKSVNVCNPPSTQTYFCLSTPWRLLPLSDMSLISRWHNRSKPPPVSFSYVHFVSAFADSTNIFSRTRGESMAIMDHYQIHS